MTAMTTVYQTEDVLAATANELGNVSKAGNDRKLDPSLPGSYKTTAGVAALRSEW